MGKNAVPTRNPIKASSSSSSTRCTLSISFLSITHKTRCAFVGPGSRPRRRGWKNPGPGRGRRRFARTRDLGREGCTAGVRWLRSEAPGCRFLPAPGKRRSGRGGGVGGSTGGAGGRPQVRARRAGPAGSSSAPSCSAQEPESSCFSLQLLGPAPQPGARSERPYTRRRAWREPRGHSSGPFLWGSAAAFP